MAEEESPRDKICAVATLMVRDIPAVLHEQLCWENFNNDLKRRLNLKKSELVMTLPGGSFDAIFQAKKKLPSSLYEYWVALETVKELESVLLGDIKDNVSDLVQSLPKIYEAMVNTKGGEEPSEDGVLPHLDEIKRLAQSVMGSDRHIEPPWALNTLLSTFRQSLLAQLSDHRNSYSSDKVVNMLKQAREGSKLKATNEMLQCEVERLLQCSGCNQIMSEPKTLPCLHSFCEECLTKAIKLEAMLATITCESCETRFQLDDSSVEEQVKTFPRHPMLDALMVFRRKCKSDKVVECKVCYGFEPSSICIQCRDLYCMFHKAGYFHDAGHSILPFEDIVLEPLRLKLKLFKLCIYHEEDLEQYCKTCKISLCNNSECLESHNSHDVLSLREACRGEEAVLSAVDGMLSSKIKLVKNRILALDDGLNQLEDMRGSIVESVEQYFDDIQKVIETKRAVFLESIGHETTKCLNDQQADKNRLQALLKKSEQVRNEFSAFLSARSDSESNMNQMQAAKVAFKRQLSECAGGATLAGTKMISYPEGKLRVLLQSVLNLTPSFNSETNEPGWEVVVKSPGIKTFSVSASGGLLFLVKSTMLSSQVYSLEVGETRTENTVMRSLGEGSVAGYVSITCLNQKTLAAMETAQTVVDLSDRKMKKTVRIKLFDSRSGSLIKVLPFQLHDKADNSWVKCHGKKFYVCDGINLSECSDISSEANLITILRRFNFHKMMTISDFYPDGVLEDLIWVTDNKKHSMLVFDGKQQVVTSVGGEGALPGKFSSPLAVTADKYGHLIVADAGNHRLQFFNRGGVFLKELAYPASAGKEKPFGQLNPGSTIIECNEKYLYFLEVGQDVIYRIRYL